MVWLLACATHTTDLRGMLCPQPAAVVGPPVKPGGPCACETRHKPLWSERLDSLDSGGGQCSSLSPSRSRDAICLFRAEPRVIRRPAGPWSWRQQPRIADFEDPLCATNNEPAGKKRAHRASHSAGVFHFRGHRNCCAAAAAAATAHSANGGGGPLDWSDSNRRDARLRVAAKLPTPNLSDPLSSLVYVTTLTGLKCDN